MGEVYSLKLSNNPQRVLPRTFLPANLTEGTNEGKSHVKGRLIPSYNHLSGDQFTYVALYYLHLLDVKN